MKKKLLILALATLLTLSLAACGDGGNTTGGGSTATPPGTSAPPVESSAPATTAPAGELDKRLVLPDGQAWMEDGEGEMYAGYVFREDGTWDFCWGEPGEEWANPEQGKWTIEDGTLMLTGDFGTRQYNYEISGSTLTITDKYTDDFVTYTQEPIPGKK